MSRRVLLVGSPARAHHRERLSWSTTVTRLCRSLGAGVCSWLSEGSAAANATKWPVTRVDGLVVPRELPSFSTWHICTGAPKHEPRQWSAVLNTSSLLKHPRQCLPITCLQYDQQVQTKQGPSPRTQPIPLPYLQCRKGLIKACPWCPQSHSTLQQVTG